MIKKTKVELLNMPLSLLCVRSKVEAGMGRLAEHRVRGETFLGRALINVSCCKINVIMNCSQVAMTN